jgi:Zn-dependent membrane protease YugP
MPFSVFPVNDTDAANAWLADKSNHNFKEWEGISLEDKNKWAELGAALLAVAGLKPHSIMENIKDAISDHLSLENTTVRAISEQKHKIAKQATTSILQNTDAKW